MSVSKVWWLRLMTLQSAAVLGTGVSLCIFTTHMTTSSCVVCVDSSDASATQHPLPSLFPPSLSLSTILATLYHS